MKNRFTILILMLLLTGGLASQTVNFRGQLSGLHVSSLSKPYSNVSGLRYIPELRLSKTTDKGLNFKAEVSFNASSYLEYFHPDSTNGQIKLKPYRIWASVSGDQAELRIGLQKMNFGSATMLRPLMWFDKMDARDPLQLTDGVYGALFRYYFLNNANLWIWGLAGNESVKGWEQFSTWEWKPEFGGRLQIPAGPGEMALSGHYRQIDPREAAIDFFIPASENPIPEFRVGMDGKWDAIAGLWFETSIEKADYSNAFPDLGLGLYSRKVTLGADYTFGIGKGITAMAEQFYYGQSDKILEKSKGMNFSAVSVSYPLTLFHNLSAMVYFDWINESWYRFINLQMVYDKWSFYIMGFWNPDNFQIYQNLDEPNVFAGKGIQLMFVYNH